MILSFINNCKVPWEVLKTSHFALGFQHFPRDLANVNGWKFMFDPSINFRHLLRLFLFTSFRENICRCSSGHNVSLSKV